MATVNSIAINHAYGAATVAESGSSATSNAPPAPFHTVLHAVAMNNGAVAESSSSHVVQRGEHLSGIVKAHLTAAGRPATNQAIADGVRRLASLNNISNPDLIHPGQVLRLAPSRHNAQSSAMLLPTGPAAMNRAHTPARRADGAALTVSDGETRWQLARGAMVADHHRRYPIPGNLPADMAARLAFDGHGRDIATSQLGARGGASSASSMNFPGNDTSFSGRIADVYESVSDIVGRARRVMAETTPEKTSGPASPWHGLLDGHGYITSDYGMRRDPFTGKMAFHQGIDIAAAYGTPIHAAASGRVAYSGWLPGYGKTIIVDHGGGTESLYGHCARLEVRKGDQVMQGTPVAAVGSTGRSTGNHLHFEVRNNGRPVNPMRLLGG